VAPSLSAWPQSWPHSTAKMLLFCRNCKQTHDTLIDCSRARRLAEYAAEQAKTIGTAAPAPKIKTILGHPSLTRKAEKPVLPVLRKTNAQYQQAFKKAKAAAGLIEVRGIWAHPDKHQRIKDFASAL